MSRFIHQPSKHTLQRIGQRWTLGALTLPLALLIGSALSTRPVLAQAPAQNSAANDGFKPLFDVTAEDEAWSSSITPRKGPERNGQPTEALRWSVSSQPIPNSPVRLTDWSGVETVRFWMYSEKAYPFKLNVLLTGSPGGYFMTTIPLDFQGWRQFTLPIADFAKVRQADLATTNSLAFRAQGYGQPALDPDMVLWLDAVEVKPKPGATLTVTNDLESNRQAWEKLAAQGNPFLLLNANRFKAEVPAFTPPAPITSAWQYRSAAEQMVPLVYAATDPKSPHRGRADLVRQAIGGIDWLVNSCTEDGTWWQPKTITGDPNVNRFTLGPLLDAVRWISTLPEGQAAWPRWEPKLAKAVDLQRRAYRSEIDWDWGGLAGGKYANQDAYYVLILALSAELWNRPADRTLAEEMMRKIATNLLPDGGIRYIGVENEAPVYHGLNLVILGRYATLTNDPTCVNLLKNTVNYWPLTLTAEGQPEYWSDVWWKQSWGYVWRDSMVTAAGATKEARNQWLMWRALERSTPNNSGMDDIYCAPYWTGTAPGQPMAPKFVVPDANIRGLRGRDGQWYFGVTQGRGLRNTFTGGLITSATGINPLRAAFRGAHIDVLLDAKQDHGLWLSQINDFTGIALRPEKAAALGARYTLQSSLINGIPTPETPTSPWQVTQIWRTAGEGSVGVIALQATEETPVAAVAGRLALGPGAVEKEVDGLWSCGPLRIKLLQSFGDVSVINIPWYSQPRDRAWPSLEMRQTVGGKAKVGDRFVYAVWVGPREAAAPTSLQLLPQDSGWVATWPNGRRTATLFNPTKTALTVAVPWSGASPQLWRGEKGQMTATKVEKGSVLVQLASGACALLETP